MFIDHGSKTWPGADFEQFVLSRSTGLLSMAALLVGDRGHAEDLLQTALLRASLRWRTAREHPEAYVRRVLINLARDRWRRSRRRVAEQSLDDKTPSPAGGRDPADAVVDQTTVRQALAGLPRRQREVVVLRFFADLPVADTAETLGMSEGTVKAHTNRALARLRQVLSEQEADLITEENHVR